MTNEPKPSHARLALLILEGYVYLLVIVGIFASSIALLVWGLLDRRPVVGLLALVVGVPVTLTTAAAIRALFFRLPEPEGIPVSGVEAPALYQMVQDVQKQVQSPKVHRILIDGSFNASASQLPRGGIFWTRNTLVIGYPLLATLSPEHLRVVVAHELGHLSRAHGRFSAWVCRTRLAWSRLMTTLEARGATPAHAYLLVRWYIPRFYEYSAAVARQQELLADRYAAQVAGRAFSAETLVAIDAAASLLERTFWDSVFARVTTESRPPSPYAELRPEVWDLIPADSTGIVRQLLEGQTQSRDTHPALQDRLRALDQEARLPARVERTAGEVYLGPQMKTVAAALDAQWRDAEAEDWHARHQRFNEHRKRLEELSSVSVPTPDQSFERGQLIEESDGEDAALPHYRAALDRGHAGASLAVGRILLGRQDDTGVPLIERAIDSDPALVAEGCLRLIRFFEKRNRMRDAHRFMVRATREQTRRQLAEP